MPIGLTFWAALSKQELQDAASELLTKRSNQSDEEMLKLVVELIHKNNEQASEAIAGLLNHAGAVDGDITRRLSKIEEQLKSRKD
ncbi:hypothetical protein [Alicyclobacillus sp. SO9]|uniref:hypothetical protein n=1 Tax=Alicyclobacillus sp. SO9 TaxID=2665646 RepID=UPI0018E6EA62|nr:hypothetical protein [Alicyclobacillus sp. SO9]QQE80885.1 hypothetical protein GI364_11170 [Alicyclobacillus sp. SO9]